MFQKLQATQFFLFFFKFLKIGKNFELLTKKDKKIKKKSKKNMRKFNFFFAKNVQNFTLIPNITFFFFFDYPKKSYAIKLYALQQKYGKWGKIGQYVFF